jgi:hypothetical protein
MAHVSKDQEGKVVLRDNWYIDDVRNVLVEGEELTDDECIGVLEDVADNFDANIGVNWDVIRYHVEIALELQNYTPTTNENN